MKLPTFLLIALCLSLPSSADEKLDHWEQLMSAAPKAIKLSKNVPQAIQLCEEAITLARTFGSNDTHLSKSQILRAEIYQWEKKYDLAEQTFKLAISSCEKAVGTNNVALVDPLSSLASCYLQGIPPRYAKAAPLHERILNIVENAPTKNNREIIRWSRNLAAIYQESGRYAECEPLFKKTVALSEKFDPEWLPYELLNTSAFYRTWGRYRQAEDHATRALTIREKAMKPDSDVDTKLDVIVCLNDLGLTYLAWSKPEKAEAVYRRSLTMARSFMAEDQADLLPPIEGLAGALRAQKRFTDAEPFYQQMQTLTAKNLGADSAEMAAVLEKYAALLNDLQKPTEAKAQLDRATAIRKQNHRE